MTSPPTADTGPLTAASIDVAINTVRQGITVAHSTPLTHQVAVVTGLEAEDLVRALGIYLTGAGILQAIRTNLAIAAEFLGVHAAAGDQLRKDTSRIVSLTNDLSQDFIEDHRNPWIAEGLGHLLLLLSRDHSNLGPPGRIEALTPIHDYVKERGLDLVGIHREDGDLVGLSVGEAKASANHASNHITGAAALFAEVDAGDREVHIRQKVLLLSGGLPADIQRRVTHGFWHARRAYLPFITYDESSTFAPLRARPNMGALDVGSDRVRLICVGLVNYNGFFDGVADEMRSAVKRLDGGA